MKKSEILQKVKTIKDILNGRFMVECEDDADWVHSLESDLLNIEFLVNDILGEEKNK